MKKAETLKQLNRSGDENSSSFFCLFIEPKQRAHSPLLAAGLASKLKTGYMVIVINMFRLGMGAYAIRRNNYMPFVNGAIFASMVTVQPRWIEAHEAFHSLRLYYIYSLSGAS
jgi:hypothetical protein